jgi:uncharacterized ion transporter superfamily protein YfcC
MSEMKDLKDQLRQLDERIDEVSGQIAKVLDIAQNLQKEYEESEKRHAQDEESRKRSEWFSFRTSLKMTTVLGAFTGLTFGYLMKAFESLPIPPFTWWFLSFALFVVLLLIVLLIGKMERPKNL